MPMELLTSPGFRIELSGFRAQGSGLRVQSPGFGVQWGNSLTKLGFALQVGGHRGDSFDFRPGLSSSLHPCGILYHLLSVGGIFFNISINLACDPRKSPFTYIRWRPYRCEYTGSLQNSEVNRSRARIVLRWGTAREVLRVLPAFV